MKLKKLLFAIGIMLGITTVSNAFTDLSSTHWAYDNVQKMADEGIVSGYNDGSFKPETNIINEEFATILTKVLGLEVDSASIKFEDVEEDRWSKSYIDAASKYYTYKKINGKNYFEPSSATTREEVAATVVRAMGLDSENPDYSILEKFSDKEQISEELRSLIAIAVKNGIMNGNANGTFKPKGNLTRAENAALMNNVKSKVKVENQEASSIQVPIMAKQDTWYKGRNDTKDMITKIIFTDSYKPTGNESESWNADNDDKGTIKCYVVGKELIIAGNGSGKIYANENSNKMFNSEFFGWDSLEEIDVSKLDVSNAVDMSEMFTDCSKLKRIDVSEWNVSNVINMSRMFNGCKSLQEIDVSKWNVSSVVNMSGMFSWCETLEKIDVSKWDVSNVTNESGTEGMVFTTETGMRKMFDGCKLLKEIDVSKWNVGNVENMTFMFSGCESLEEIDVSKWNVSNVTNIAYMFDDCSKLEKIDVSKWDVSNVTNMSNMFNECKSLEKIDVSKWNVSNVTDMSYMFGRGYIYDTNGCSSLKKVDVSKWNVSNVIKMNGMFSGCKSLEKIDVSKWNVSNVTDMSYMFENCSSLKKIDISKWENDKEEKRMTNAFKGCISLKTLKVGEKFVYTEDIGLPENITITK